MKISKVTLFILILTVSACACAVLAIYNLVELQHTTQATVGLEHLRTKSANKIVRDDDIGMDEEALHVDLSRRRLTSAQMNHLGRFNAMQVLDLRWCQLPQQGIAPLSKKTIRELYLQGVNLDHPDAVLESMPRLERLDLSETPIDDSTVAALRHAPVLYWLDLHATRITDEALDSLAQMPALRHLALSGDNITDSSLVKLQAVRHLSKIRLINAQVTTKGLCDLVKGSPGLKCVVLQHCPRIGAAEFDLLSKSCPNCQFVQN